MMGVIMADGDDIGLQARQCIACGLIVWIGDDRDARLADATAGVTQPGNFHAVFPLSCEFAGGIIPQFAGFANMRLAGQHINTPAGR
jgi:hypothetical protein